MAILRDILYKSGIVDTQGDLDITVNGLAFDSRQVQDSDAFIAVKGATVDGHRFIEIAIEKGAAAIIYDDPSVEIPEGICSVRVANSALALGTMSSEFYGNPSSKLSLIGVTGTNGKTTIVTLLHQLFTGLGYPSGMLSTIENKIGDLVIPATHTTPDPLQLNKLLSTMVDEGVDYCFMEVSSHAVVQHRIAGLTFKGGVFTNLTRDHLDYHQSFSNYRDAKKTFFDGLGKEAFAIVNIDDKNGRVMVQNSNAEVKRYSLQSPAEYRARILEKDFTGMKLDLCGTEFWTPLTGRFNAYNLLAVYGTAIMVGAEEFELLQVMSQATTARGRFEQIRSTEGIIAILDYAHTPDALTNVLQTITDIRTGNEQIITIVGAGGNRDKGKRPQMAEVAAGMSNKVILTSDNPRDEDPEDILDDMLTGIGPHHKMKAVKITDRRQAILTAVMMARPGDIILLAGKGHENYQEIKGVKHPFDDLVELKIALGIQD